MSSVAQRIAVCCTLLIATVPPARGQTRIPRPSARGPAAEDSTRVTLALAVGSRRFDEAKQGRCLHAPKASIYNTLAAMWSVNYAPSPDQSISLTVWRPISGDTAAQMNFDVFANGKSQRIATLKAAETRGTGTVQITKHGAGGRFDINGTTADGSMVRGYIDCEKFSAPAPVGGN